MTATPDALEIAESVPQAAPVQPAPDSAHVTPLFPESFATVAVNVIVFATCTEAVAIDMLTVTPVGVGGVVDFVDPVQPPSRVKTTQSAATAATLQKERFGFTTGISRILGKLELQRPVGISESASIETNKPLTTAA